VEVKIVLTVAIVLNACVLLLALMQEEWLLAFLPASGLVGALALCRSATPAHGNK
jgi:hypothetical protein